MNKLLLIDGNSLINRAYFALPPLNDDRGVNVNAVYGFTNLLLSALNQYDPTHLLVAFDAGGHNMRKDIYSQYKANRKGMPDDLAQQMPILQDLLAAMGVHFIKRSGIEADDIIGTMATKLAVDSVIVTGDKDMLQLVSDKVSVALTKRGITEVDLVQSDNIVEKCNMTAQQVVEYKALRGDSSDNIPGVKGIGDKTALSLLASYSDLDGVYNNIDNIKGAVQSKLIADKDMAYISKQLATIDCQLDIECTLDECKLPVMSSAVKTRMQQLRFRSILARVEFEGEPSVPRVENTTVTIDNIEQFVDIVSQLATVDMLAMYIADDSICVASNSSTSYVIACSDSFLDPLTHSSVLMALADILFDDKIAKVLWDNKSVAHQLHGYGVAISGVKYDLALMQYLTEPRSAKNLAELLDSLNMDMCACNMIGATRLLLSKLEANDNMSLYSDVELPLSHVLYDMEQCGVAVDKEELDRLSSYMSEQLAAISSEIYQLAGEQFNISSPKQLSVIIFEKLMLKHGKKTATGYSTNSDVLDKLKDQHPIINKVIEYRHIAKLQSTYVEGLRPLIVEGRIHTTYNGFLTTTGRLSSSDPNLQNIPIRTEQGRAIRKVFVSSNGTFVGADYSQIELRLLAAFSGDSNLLKAFHKGLDIHAMVASELMGIPIEMVNSQMRRTAKAVNFGIIYGISDFGLSENTGLTVKKAHDYIQLYFERFPSIKQYLDGCVATAKDKGYVTTLLGRRRYIPEISSANFNLRSFGERAAMNMPLQGSAADIMKVAMINTYNALVHAGLKSKLILQIHDEIIVDCYLDEVEQVKAIIVECMDNAVSLRCPLTVDVEEGINLYEA